MGRCLPLAVLLLISLSQHTFGAEKPKPPNVVIVYADDMGYGDFG